MTGEASGATVNDAPDGWTKDGATRVERMVNVALIGAGGVSRKHVAAWRVARGAFQLARGYRESLRWLDRDAPGAVFATGGYAAAPVGRAARRRGIRYSSSRPTSGSRRSPL